MPNGWIPPSSRIPAAKATSGESRRAELLRVAIDVFGDQGFAGARIDEIARRVGIRRPSVLYHFSDKATLHYAAITAVVRNRTSACSSIAASPDDRRRATSRLSDADWTLAAATSFDDPASN